jgi:hypothetical protein
LAGFGFDYVINSKQRKYYLIFISVFLVLVGFGIYALKINQAVGIRNLILPASVLVASFIAIKIKKLNYFLIGLSILELFYFGWKFTPFSPRELVFPETPVITFLKTHEGQYRVTGDHVIPINLLMAYGIKTVEGYDAVYPSKTSEFINKVNNNPSGVFRRYGIIDNDISPLLDDVNTKYYLALKTDPDLKRFSSKRFRKVFEDKSVLVYESLTVSNKIVENEYKPDTFFNGLRISLVSGVILLLLYLRHRNEK